MKVKFTKFEKVTGVFVLAALALSLFSFVGIAVKKGWFSPRESYYTHLPSAEGVSVGTAVQMSGLKIGSVTGVELISQDKVKVQFDVFSEYTRKIGSGSQVMVFRPFLIGDKVIDIQAQVDSEEEPLRPGSEIPALASTDIMDILSGKKMSLALNSIDELTSSLRVIGEAFADEKRAKEFVRLLDQLEPLVKNMNKMSVEMSKVTNVALKERRMEIMMDNLNVLTAEFKKITPAIATIAPKLPETSLRAVEALNETVILLKAMQKSFFLRSHVEAVREEEEERKPAGSK